MEVIHLHKALKPLIQRSVKTRLKCTRGRHFPKWTEGRLCRTFDYKSRVLKTPPIYFFSCTTCRRNVKVLLMFWVFSLSLDASRQKQKNICSSVRKRNFLFFVADKTIFSLGEGEENARKPWGINLHYFYDHLFFFVWWRFFLFFEKSLCYVKGE